MVDAIVSFTIERLGDFLIQKATILAGVRHDVEWLRNTLQYMQCFLKDAEQRQDEDPRIRKWVSDVANAAYEADDVIDEFILKIADGGHQRGFKAFLVKCVFIWNKEAYIYKRAYLNSISTKIKALKVRINEIDQNQKAFQLRNINDPLERSSRINEKLRELRRTGPYANDDDDHIVGFEKDAELLKDELLKNQPHRCVISILGMGGLGKTTLARNLYNNSSIRGQFQCYAWVSVSMEYKTKDLLQSIMRSFKPPRTKEELEKLEKMTVEDFERELREYLEGLRYLVVVDDVWEKEAWESLKRAFPDSKNGSRVIITTRIKAVAERSDERTYVYELPFLAEEESWKLFCKKAFSNSNVEGDIASHCPPNMEKLGKDMVEKCRGLPLAIVVLGGLMSRKPYDEWPKVQDRMWRFIRDESIHVKFVLALSYNDLPCELKLCFLYLAMYPEDCEIEVEKLLHLWVAEGFIQPEPGIETLEEIAAQYLHELIDRNLIQIARRIWRRIYYCRMHDLLRDLAIEKAEELNLLQIYERMIRHSTFFPDSLLYRRLASHSGFERFRSSNHSFPRLHTLYFFNQEFEDFEPLFAIIQTNFTLLRVLDFEGVRFSCVWPGHRGKLPAVVGKLIHLRYLGLRETEIDELPPSIGNLRALQTLDAYTEGCHLFLPYEICDAKELRHLHGYCFQCPSRVKSLTNLQTLRTVAFSRNTVFDPTSLINLRELRVECAWQGLTLDYIGKVRSLQSFSLIVLASDGNYFPSLQPLSQCHNLIQLRLRGPIKKLPREMHEFLPNLKYLHLEGEGMEEDPMPTLEKLPDLTILAFGVRYRYRGRELACTAGGFPRLQALQLYDCSDAKELRVEEGSMPLLRSLEFFGAHPKNIRIPERLRSIGHKNDRWWAGRRQNFEIWPY